MKSNLLIIILCFFCTNLIAGELPRPNKFGGDFTLDSTLGKPASISDWKDKVVLLNFGFTSCPDVCPMVLSKLTLVKKQLDKSFFGNETNDIQVIFVTVDPDRDTVQKLQTYLKAFHPSFVGMRGSQEEFTDVLKRYGASVKIENKGTNVEVSHSDYVYIIDKQGYVAGFYDVNADYEILMDAVSELL
jgi:protein SCO1/2